jgi:hypothetical protein
VKLCEEETKITKITKETFWVQPKQTANRARVDGRRGSGHNAKASLLENTQKSFGLGTRAYALLVEHGTRKYDPS